MRAFAAERTTLGRHRALDYEAIHPVSREEAEAALARDDPEELHLTVLSVSLHSENGVWGCSLCLRLASHQHVNVRGNAILGLGHLARRFGRLDPAARAVIELGLRDADPYVRGHAHNAADDARHFLRWRITQPD